MDTDRLIELINGINNDEVSGPTPEFCRAYKQGAEDMRWMILSIIQKWQDGRIDGATN